MALQLTECSQPEVLAAGVPPKVIQEMLGHSQISTTMNIYAHVMPNFQQEAADALDTMFRQAEV